MTESEGIHGPGSEQVIASLFEKHHGPNVYNMREGRIPSWYTDNMQYFYEIYKGKILSTLGYIDKQTYYILGGAFVYSKWKKDSGYFGKPFTKLMGMRETKLKRDLPKIAGFKYSGPVTPDRNQETYIEMMSQYYDIDPVDTKGIPEDMVDNFSKRYPNAWGIRRNGNSDSLERMAKGLSDWFSSSWWDVVKVQVLDTSTGIQTINEPMIEDKDCYNKLMQKIESWFSNPKIVSLKIDKDYLDNVIEYTNFKPARVANEPNFFRSREDSMRGRLLEDYSSNEMEQGPVRDIELSFYGTFRFNDKSLNLNLSEDEACTILEILDLVKSNKGVSKGELNGFDYLTDVYDKIIPNSTSSVAGQNLLTVSYLLIIRRMGQPPGKDFPVLYINSELYLSLHDSDGVNDTTIITNLEEVKKSLNFFEW